MFREVYTQPLSDIRQSSVGGIEKHVRSYIILWSYPLAFKNTPKCFRNIQLWRIWRQEKEEKSSLLPYWANFFDLLVSMYGSIVKDNKSVHLQVERSLNIELLVSLPEACSHAALALIILCLALLRDVQLPRPNSP